MEIHDDSRSTLDDIQMSELDNTSLDDLSSQIILAVNYRANALGFAFYACHENRLSVVEDLHASPALVEKYHAGWDIIDSSELDFDINSHRGADTVCSCIPSQAYDNPHPISH